MHWFGLVLFGLVILASACGGGTGAEGSSGEGDTSDGHIQDALETTNSPIRDALESKLEPALLRDLPLLEEEEASCISMAILAGLPDFGTALEDPESFAEAILADTQAAQDSCLTPDRIAELEANETSVLTREPAEKAFLLLIRGGAGGVDTEDEDLMVAAGYLLCSLAEEAGSLEDLVGRLGATPVSSAKIAVDFLPLFGRVLSADELITLSTNAVVALCPEASDR